MSLSYLLLITNEFGSPGLLLLFPTFFFIIIFIISWLHCGAGGIFVPQTIKTMPSALRACRPLGLQGSPSPTFFSFLFSSLYVSLSYIKIRILNQVSRVHWPHVSGLFKAFPSCYKCTGENMELLATRPWRHLPPASTSTQFIRHLLKSSFTPGPWEAFGTQKLITPRACPWFVSGHARLASQAKMVSLEVSCLWPTQPVFSQQVIPTGGFERHLWRGKQGQQV